MFFVREAEEKDLSAILYLYTQLHDNPLPENSDGLLLLWNNILKDNNHHIILGVLDGKAVSSCVCVVVPNLTHNQRPYALVENVITDGDYRKKGYATACLDFAKNIAHKENCYKIMLLTGSKQKSTLDFYKRAGYNSNDKTAFIQWL